MFKISNKIGQSFFLLRANSIKTTLRNYSEKKRFYKNINVLHNDGKYEITLDHRKLKTPHGTPFTIENEPLALAVATEWENQKDTINQATMHLTSLCNTAIDNPNHLSKIDMVNYVLNFLTTDTVLFQTGDNDDLYEIQSKEWDPLIEWFCTNYNVKVDKSRDILTPQVSSETKMKISKHLMSYDIKTLHAYVFAVDTLKSIILTLACLDRKITVERAVYLSRLEEEFQLKFWGRVEYAHDLSQYDLQARLSAAVLFIHFNSSSVFVKEKLVM